VYANPTSSDKIFCTINVATVFDSSDPNSIVRKHNGIISVLSKKLITSVSSTFTNAPITPNDVNRKYSNGLVLLTVFKNGYKNNGTCAFKNCARVSGCDATHWSKANALHTLFDA
jgi:hypothetical protein|tara:strand:- start:9 stop:353 length:345 start_codon:yes stop_codon:yes gene_type:complete